MSMHHPVKAFDHLHDICVRCRFEQDRITARGIAVQCRVTTENPERNFAPDTGTLSVYRHSAGYGMRQVICCSCMSLRHVRRSPSPRKGFLGYAQLHSPRCYVGRHWLLWDDCDSIL